MMHLLSLIDAAQQLADPDTYILKGRSWQMEGGRSCPIDWWDCSQPVFVDAVTDEQDYGEKGGPGHQWCLNHCPHGMEPAPAEEVEPAQAQPQKDSNQ